MSNGVTTQKKFRKADEIDPDKDGIDFINMYSQCATRLGRRLSHFARTPFIHPFFGPFESLEGFWFYIKTNKQYDELRYKYGIHAKREGKMLAKTSTVHNPNFQEDILAGNYQKIIQDKGLLQSFKASELPLTHFYLFRRDTDNPEVSLKPIVIFPRNSDWLIDGLEDIRESLKAGVVPECWVNASKRYVSETTDK